MKTWEDVRARECNWGMQERLGNVLFRMGN